MPICPRCASRSFPPSSASDRLSHGAGHGARQSHHPANADDDGDPSFWTSFLIRVYAWIGILKPEGLLTLALQSLHILGPEEQVQIFRTDWAVFIGIVYSYLPFMVLPLYSAPGKAGWHIAGSGKRSGCPPWKAFWRITFPLSMPGVLAGSLICFIPITGEFVIPDLLGGASTLDDRQDTVDGILWQPGLAAGLRRGGAPAVGPCHSHRHFPEPAAEGGLR